MEEVMVHGGERGGGGGNRPSPLFEKFSDITTNLSGIYMHHARELL